MDLTGYVDDLQRRLAIAAEAGGDQARSLAERLTAPLDAAARLVLLEALAAAAGEITAELAPGSVDVRLRGRDPEFVVTAPPVDRIDEHPTMEAPPDPAPVGATAPGAVDGDDSGTSRVTLRLPEPLKVRIEEAAGREGLSVNSWLVRTLNGALDPPRAAPRARRSATGGDRFTGWTTS